MTSAVDEGQGRSLLRIQFAQQRRGADQQAITVPTGEALEAGSVATPPTREGPMTVDGIRRDLEERSARRSSSSDPNTGARDRTCARPAPNGERHHGQTGDTMAIYPLYAMARVMGTAKKQVAGG